MMTFSLWLTQLLFGRIAYHFLLLANAIVLNASLGLLLRFVNGCVGHDATVLSEWLLPRTRPFWRA